MRALGYPSTPEEIAALGDRTEMDALVAYLLRLGKEMKQ
jgi:cbb3-type cytochrome oxidase cytochrome c subunit